MKTALAYHLLARLQSCRGDFRTALMNERETYQIYKALVCAFFFLFIFN